jgi:Arc/MetJ-type ribon-helix-helix transcriptional regulator
MLLALEGPMGIVQVQLPDDLKAAIDRQVAEGRAASEAEFMLEAARRYAEDLDAEVLDADDEVVSMVEEGNAAIARGDYIIISSPEDAEALHQRLMDRLRANLDAERG